MSSNRRAREAAMALLVQYGEDASVIATLRAAIVAAPGELHRCRTRLNAQRFSIRW